MKRVALTILITLLLAVCSPLTVELSPYEDGSYIVTLDVCGSSHAAVSVNAESPAIQECCCRLEPAGFAGYVSVRELTYNPSIHTLSVERPPKV